MRNTEVTLPREIIETVIARTKEEKVVPESTLKALEETITQIDGEHGVYGYGVYNTNTHTMIPIPNKSEKTRTHVTKTWGENLLVQVKNQYGFESIDNLRIVRVTLANTIDEQEAKEVIDMKS
jgi:hypothetical protein